MLSAKNFGLIMCHECGERFNECQSIYTILSRTWYPDLAKFQQEYVTNDDGVMIPKELNFHQNCFVNVAGKSYSP